MKTFNRMKNKIKSAKIEFLFVFTGPVIKTILIIMLAACAVAYGFNKDNEKIKRNILAIGVATAILMASTFIVGLVWGDGAVWT